MHPTVQTEPMLDDLAIYSLREDPDRWEALIKQEQVSALTNPLAAQILRSVYWEADRDRAFQRYGSGLDFQLTLKLLGLLAIDPEHSLVEIGGGSGFLAWALSRRGYGDVTLLEPNSHFTTGTGYLRTREDAQSVRIENSLDAFYHSDRTYKTVVTRNCVHHFENITFAAAAIRQKVDPGGRWIMIREPLVESAGELYRFLHGHPYSQAYGVFEFGYPASHFIDALTMAGFRLNALVPERYANNALSLYVEDSGGAINRQFTAVVDHVLSRAPVLSRAGYQVERIIRRLFRLRAACFTRPQVLVFERQELGELPESAIWYRPATPDAEHDARGHAA